MPGTQTYHASDAKTCEVTPIEWRRSAPGQWHRVRSCNSMALCDRPMPAATERRDLEKPPRRSSRCKQCERFWRIVRWAYDRLQIS